MPGRGIEHPAQNVGIQGFRLFHKAHKRCETPKENVVAFGVQYVGFICHKVCQPGCYKGIIIQEVCKKVHHFHNVRIFCRNGVAHKHPQGLFNINVAQLFPVGVPQPKLLVKSKQAGGEILFCVVFTFIRLASHVQNERVFTVAVFIKKLIGIIEQNALCINFFGSANAGLTLFFCRKHKLCFLCLGEFFQAGSFKQHFGPFFQGFFFSCLHSKPFGHGLPKRGGIFKGKAPTHQCLAPA
ncbi:hypothetical protein SDC9_61449 [bioreactor metagenome]|uniref:Uncharacterized protein n=1 Tax=bioreactor metagenome TaxID=1076179 RepID=A0A644XLH9_9ZZZZ